MTRCPLCDSPFVAPSWFPAAAFEGRRFPYAQCRTCGSHFSDPMPDTATLSAMYGATYAARPGEEPADDAGAHEDWVATSLSDLPRRGVFLDYGCGAGRLLTLAKGLGWDPIGVELEETVARRVHEATGVRTLVAAALTHEHVGLADVVHLGDVVEHLTQPLDQLKGILRLLRPGGLLLAQGPLEANPNVFLGLLRTKQLLRPTPVGSVPPYHVLLATARGQRQLFKRAGLQEQEIVLSEVDWPAPSRLSFGDLRHPGTLMKYAARRVSRATTLLLPNRLGNRYAYRGRIA